MKKHTIALALLCWAFSMPAYADQEVIALKTSAAPVIDGSENDAAWQDAPVTTTMDPVANIPIELQAVFTTEHLYMKVRFPDATENREHKTLVWNSSQQLYKTGPKREDLFAFKWNMEPVPVDLSLQSTTPYSADLWLWKAFRTDPAGYSDDKMHIYSDQEQKGAKPITLTSGKRFFLDRPGDMGTSTYQSIAYDKYSGESVVRYKHRQPDGSRSDVQAKGRWSAGYWTIEFQRKLITGHTDDVQFDPALPYDFGVSRFEIAGKRPNPKLEQPNYESGDVSERLTLIFQ